MNILIMRAFVKLRELLATHKDLPARSSSWKPPKNNTRVPRSSSPVPSRSTPLFW